MSKLIPNLRCAGCGSAVTETSSICMVCGSRARTRIPVARLNSHEPTIAYAMAGAGSIAIAEPRAMPRPAVRARPIATPRTQRGKVRRRPLALALVMLLVAMLMTGDMIRSLSQIYEISTPPATISGDLLGGSAETVIDTAPAAAAVAAQKQADVAPTGGTVADVADSSFTAPAAATGPQDVEPVGAAALGGGTTNDGADAEPASVSQPVLSDIERLTNADFTNDLFGWYFDEGTTVAAGLARDGGTALQLGTGGGYADQAIFLIPGKSYHLTASGRMTETGDIARVGVLYRDANGNRLQQLEPTPLEFTSTSFTSGEFDFTPPAEVASVQVYLWKEMGSAAFIVDFVSARTWISPGEQLANVTGDTASMTILWMGVDRRPGEPLDFGVRPDSLMVLNLNSETGSCRLLSVPRDSYVELPGYGKTKINHALTVGGIEYQRLVIEQFLGITIDHYVLMDFNGFKDVIDSIGGIDVEIAEPFVSDDGTTFEVGIEHMDGARALSFSRWRGDSNGDFGRMQRQQAVLRGVMEKTTGLNTARAVDEVLPVVQDNLRTDLSPSAIVGIGNQYRTGCTSETVSMDHIEGEIAWHDDDPLLHMRLCYVDVDAAEVRRKVAALYGK